MDIGVNSQFFSHHASSVGKQGREWLRPKIQSWLLIEAGFRPSASAPRGCTPTCWATRCPLEFPCYFALLPISSFMQSLALSVSSFSLSGKPFIEDSCSVTFNIQEARQGFKSKARLLFIKGPLVTTEGTVQLWGLLWSQARCSNHPWSFPSLHPLASSMVSQIPQMPMVPVLSKSWDKLVSLFLECSWTNFLL